MEKVAAKANGKLIIENCGVKRIFRPTEDIYNSVNVGDEYIGEVKETDTEKAVKKMESHEKEETQKEVDKNIENNVPRLILTTDDGHIVLDIDFVEFVSRAIMGDRELQIDPDCNYTVFIDDDRIGKF